MISNMQVNQYEEVCCLIAKEALLDFIKEPVVWTVLQEMSKRVRHVDDQLEGLSVDDQLCKEHLEI